MPSVHRPPTPQEQAVALVLLDYLAQLLGYSGIRAWGASAAMARAVGVHPGVVCRYVRGVRAMSAATAGWWTGQVLLAATEAKNAGVTP